MTLDKLMLLMSGFGWCESVFKFFLQSSVYLTAWCNPGYCITSTGQHQQIDTVVNKTIIIDIVLHEMRVKG